MARLYISQLDDLFDQSVDIALGPWCFPVETEFESYKNTACIRSPLSEPEQLDAAARYCDQYAEYCMQQFFPRLNQLNKVNYSYETWRCLIMPTLLTLIHVFYERMVRVDEAIKQYADHSLSIKTVHAEIATFKTQNADELLGVIFSDEFNCWVNSFLIEKLKPEGWATERENFQPEPKGVVKDEAGLFTGLKQFVKGLVPRLPVSALYPTWSIFFSVYLSLISLTIRNNKKESTVNKDREFVKPSGGFSSELQLEKVLWELLPSKLKRALIRPRRYWVKTRCFPAGAFYWDYQGQVELARAIECGCSVIGAQHGATYGLDQTTAFIANIEYRQQCFLTWGWTRHGDYKGNFYSLPSCSLSKIKRKSYNKTNIYFVGTRMATYSYRLDSYLQPDFIFQYRQNKSVFITGLNSSVKSILSYRPYRANKEFDEGFIKRNFPEINVVNKLKHLEELCLANLVILDHPGTTLCQCLAANIPVICFWDKKAFQMADTAEVYFEQLQQNKILFYSPEEAAQHVNGIANDIESWWQSAAVQQARQSWASQYARTSKYWYLTWIKRLPGVLKSIHS